MPAAEPPIDSLEAAVNQVADQLSQIRAENSRVFWLLVLIAFGFAFAAGAAYWMTAGNPVIAPTVTSIKAK